MKEFDFEKVPIVEIANEILLDGVKKGASDIHFDPCKDGISIRMRVDGVLYDYAKVPQEFKRNMISRIKMIASMNIMETRLPQDGAIKSKIGDKMLDLRVSSLPTHSGEKVVLRILDYSKSLQGLESLGFSDHNLDKIIKMIEMPNGIVLVTGATGSGKSTTVYSILQKLNTREVNIITVEDPVEMEVEGLNQVQAQQEIGLDFATVLRSILRQDPDIIMIGEIRDGETASIAVRASITGHKVLSTIHTNSALNTIERLTDMGVERYLIGTSLNGVISQKLARKICPYCRIARETTDYEKTLFKKVTHKEVNRIYDINKEGCEHCFKGYKGRICVAEVLVITDEVRTAITNAESKDKMRKLVYIDAHTHTLLEDGLEKVIAGETNFEEILKLVDLENDLAIHNAFYDEVEAELAKLRKEGKLKDEGPISVPDNPHQNEVKKDEPINSLDPSNIDGTKTEETSSLEPSNIVADSTPAVAVPVPVVETQAPVVDTTPAIEEPKMEITQNETLEQPQVEQTVENVDLNQTQTPQEQTNNTVETFDVNVPQTNNNLVAGADPLNATIPVETLNIPEQPSVQTPKIETFDVTPSVPQQQTQVQTNNVVDTMIPKAETTVNNDMLIPPAEEVLNAIPSTTQNDINFETLVPQTAPTLNPNVTVQTNTI